MDLPTSNRKSGRLCLVSLKSRKDNSEPATEITSEQKQQTEEKPRGHIDRFRLKLKQMSVTSFSNNSSASLEDSCEEKVRNRGLGLATSSKILAGIAVNWRAKSVQSKHERRERRATKTLAVVLGGFVCISTLVP